MGREIFIIHGAYGSPDENWFQWLAHELESLGHSVHIPEFPTPEGQNLENWMDAFEEHRSKMEEDTIMIGHSLGPAFILNVLEQIETSIDAAFFASGFTGLLDKPEFDKINKTITDREFDFNQINSNCGDFYLYHGSDDPNVPLNKAVDLARRCHTGVYVIPNGGHLNEDAGYTNFPKILEDIRLHLGE